MVAHSHQTISYRTVWAGGCDIGIYVGAGVTHVTIDSVRVTGANFQGIFAEKTSDLTIENSLVHNNGFHTIDPSAPPQPGSGVRSYVGQAFGISLFGVSHVTVKGNTVTDNGRGGIGVMDNGPNDPGTITQNPSAPVVPSSYVRVIGNMMSGNYLGCGLVAATQNFGGSLSHLWLDRNTVSGKGMSAKWGPDIGGIVVAADLPNSWVNNVSVRGNKVTNSFEGGVIVNAEAFNSSTKNVHIISNTITGNNWGHLEAPNTAGVIVNANPAAQVPPGMKAPENVFTVVFDNTITKQFYGIYSAGRYRPIAFGNHIHVLPGGIRVFHAH